MCKRKSFVVHGRVDFKNTRNTRKKHTRYIAPYLYNPLSQKVSIYFKIIHSVNTQVAPYLFYCSIYPHWKRAQSIAGKKSIGDKITKQARDTISRNISYAVFCLKK